MECCSPDASGHLDRVQRNSGMALCYEELMGDSCALSFLKN